MPSRAEPFCSATTNENFCILESAKMKKKVGEKGKEKNMKESFDSFTA